MSNESGRRPRRWVWFMTGLLVAVVAVGAVGYTVPVLSCQTCTFDGAPEAAQVTDPVVDCKDCSQGKVTIWEVLEKHLDLHKKSDLNKKA